MVVVEGIEPVVLRRPTTEWVVRELAILLNCRISPRCHRQCSSEIGQASSQMVWKSQSQKSQQEDHCCFVLWQPVRSQQSQMPMKFHRRGDQRLYPVLWIQQACFRSLWLSLASRKIIDRNEDNLPIPITVAFSSGGGILSSTPPLISPRLNKLANSTARCCNSSSGLVVYSASNSDILSCCG